MCMYVWAILVLGASSALLTSSPASLEGALCPAEVRLSCMGTELFTMRWYIDNEERAKYNPSAPGMDSFPLEISLTPRIDGVMVKIISSWQIAPMSNHFNILSRLTVNSSSITSFNWLRVQCGTEEIRSNEIVTNFTVTRKLIYTFTSR